jgi:hypothetical protein
MTELFLSYSRAQKEFVTSLFHALEQEGFDSWIDWDDILPSEAWRKAIQSGIEAAHTFLFVISPASAESEVCRSEIEWAIKSHKRLIVVVREDIDASKLHPEIREINWIFCRQTDSFEEAIRKLVATLSCDIDYVKSHARLLVRSIEWENSKRNPSYLLRGSDLKEAEGWIVMSTQQKSQHPTELQAEFIYSSRRASSRRMRILIASLSTLLLSSVIASFVAITQRSLAETRKAQAEEYLEAAYRQIIGMVDGLQAMDHNNINFSDADGNIVPASVIFGRESLLHSRDVFERNCGQIATRYGWSLP